MAEEQSNLDQVNETLETKNEEVKQEQNTEENKGYSQADIEGIVKSRLARERAKIYKELGTDNLDDVKSLLQEKETRELEDKKKRGEFIIFITFPFFLFFCFVLFTRMQAK